MKIREGLKAVFKFSFIKKLNETTEAFFYMGPTV